MTSNKELNRCDLNPCPFAQFSAWFKEIKETKIIEPNAMSLATCYNEQPSVRNVLLKKFNKRGFVFFTNYNSNKAKQINKNPQASLLFTWLILLRQVRIYGNIAKITKKESDKYFASRVRGTQLGSWASKQSMVVSSRKELTNKFSAIRKKFAGNEVPPPDFWGGYRLSPQTIEFWQSRENHLHDRFIYTKTNNKWIIERLYP